MKITQILSFLKFDIFNHQFFLRIGQKNKNSTTFSTIISHILMITMIIYFLFSSFNTFLHTNPQTNIQDFDVTTRSNIHLSNENFHFAFRFENNDGNSMNISNLSKYFKIETSYFDQNHNISEENSVWDIKKELNFEFDNCAYEDFLDFEDYYRINLKHAFCLKNHNMDLAGFWDEPRLAYLYITINMCDEEDPNCVGRATIEKLFQGCYLTFYIETQNVDSNDYHNPSKKSMKYYSYLLDTNIKKDVNFYIKEVKLNTYDALFFNTDPSQKKFFKQNSIDLDFNTNFINKSNTTLNAFWEIYLYSSNQVQVIERTYTTLTAVFASVGGISKFLLIIGTFITLYYNEMKLQSELLNEFFVFNFEDISEKNKKRTSIGDKKKMQRNFTHYLDKGNTLSASAGTSPTHQFNFELEKLKKQFSNDSPINEINLFDSNRRKKKEKLLNGNESEFIIDSPERRFNSNLNNLKHFDLSKQMMDSPNKKIKNPLDDLNHFELSKQVSLTNINLEKIIIIFSDEEIKEESHDKFDKEINFEIPRTINRKNHTFPIISDLNSHRQLLTKRIEEEMCDSNKNHEHKKNLKDENNNEKDIEFENKNPKATDIIKENKNENKKENELIIERDQIKEDKKTRKINEKNLLEIHLNQSLKKLNEAKSSQKNKINFTFWEIIRSTFFPFFLPKEHKKKLKLYRKASGDLLKYINIMQIVQMLQQLEKLKLIIFNKNQLALFNYLSKPMISLDSNISSSPREDTNQKLLSDNSGNKLSKIMRYMERGNTKEQCKDIINYYNELLETGAYSEFDQKLFELLDDDLRTVLNHFGNDMRSEQKIK